MFVTEVLKTATRLVDCCMCVCCRRHHALEALLCIHLLSPHLPLFARCLGKIAKEHKPMPKTFLASLFLACYVML